MMPNAVPTWTVECAARVIASHCARLLKGRRERHRDREQQQALAAPLSIAPDAEMISVFIAPQQTAGVQDGSRTCLPRTNRAQAGVVSVSVSYWTCALTNLALFAFGGGAGRQTSLSASVLAYQLGTARHAINRTRYRRLRLRLAVRGGTPHLENCNAAAGVSPTRSGPHPFQPKDMGEALADYRKGES
jgi:hypothetical protein